MTINLEIVCDRCSLLSNDRFDFYDRHFSRISDDGEDFTEYFHLCKKCQHAIADKISSSPYIHLITVAESHREGVALVGGDEMPNLNNICRTHKGIII